MKLSEVLSWERREKKIRALVQYTYQTEYGYEAYGYVTAVEFAGTSFFAVQRLSRQGEKEGTILIPAMDVNRVIIDTADEYPESGD